MTNPPGGRRRRYVLAAAVFLFLNLLLWAMYAYGLATEMDHSRFRVSASIEDARGRGVLRTLPALEDSTFLYAGEPLRVREAWIEEVTQVRYRWFLPWTRRVVGLGTYRLVLHVVPADGMPWLSQDRRYLMDALCATSGGDTISGFGWFGEEGPLHREIGTRVPGRLTFHTGSPTCPKREFGAGL